MVNVAIRALLSLVLISLGPAAAFADPAIDCDYEEGYEGISACDKAIKADPKNARLYYNRGTLYQDLDELDPAIADFTKAIALDPKDKESFLNRGAAYYAKKEFDRAIADYDRAIEIDAKYSDAYNNRGNAYDAKGEYERAVADYTMSLRLEPSACTYTNRGGTLRTKGDIDGAIADYDKAIETEADYTDAYVKRGSAFQARGDLDRAIADFKKATELDPDSASHLKRLGIVRFINADYANASSVLLRSLELSDDAYAMVFRFLARARMGQSAVEELEANTNRLTSKSWPFAVTELYLGKRSPLATLDAAPSANDRCEAQFYVGEWHLLKGDKAEAEKSLQAAAETCPKTHNEQAAAMADLKRLKP